MMKPTLGGMPLLKSYIEFSGIHSDLLKYNPKSRKTSFCTYTSGIKNQKNERKSMILNQKEGAAPAD
jgi:hypothetical protein